MTTIGVLALQGDFREHIASLRRLGVNTREVRQPTDLSGLDGLILPGGESTTIARLLQAYALYDPIQRRGQNGFPLMGTCAGAILLATDVRELDRPSLGLLPLTIFRNAYGRQLDSFEAELPAPILSAAPYHAVFIRAPRIRSVAPAVEVLMTLDETGEPIAVRWKAILATTFHPELTKDPRWHAYFLEHCVRAGQPDKHTTPSYAAAMWAGGMRTGDPV